MADKKVADVFVEPSQAGPTQKLVPQDDGTTKVVPGKAHEAREGRVTNPSVRTMATTGQGARCPNCGNTTLKARMNRKVGKRIYCESCPYDQGKENNGLSADVKIVGQSVGGSGVKIVRSNQHGE